MVFFFFSKSYFKGGLSASDGVKRMVRVWGSLGIAGISKGKVGMSHTASTETLLLFLLKNIFFSYFY